MMASDIKKDITDRFVKGIRRSFSPCPLIGPKWLQEFPNGRPADYRFFGIRKLSKAIGQPVETILKTVLKNTSFKGLDVDVEVVGGVYIDIFIKGKPRAEKKRYDKGNSRQEQGRSRRQKRGFSFGRGKRESAEGQSA